MGFIANVHKDTLDLSIIPPLLIITREVYELDNPPAGYLGCDDCQLLERLLEIAGGEE